MMQLTVIVGVAAAVAIGVISGIFYFYYQTSQEQLNELSKANAAQHEALKGASALNEELRDTLEKQQQLSAKLNESLKKSENKLEDLRAVLRKHDLTNLSLKKPGLIENRINKATDEIFLEFENETDTNLTD